MQSRLIDLREFRARTEEPTDQHYPVAVAPLECGEHRRLTLETARDPDDAYVVVRTGGVERIGGAVCWMATKVRTPEERLAGTVGGFERRRQQRFERPWIRFEMHQQQVACEIPRQSWYRRSVAEGRERSCETWHLPLLFPFRSTSRRHQAEGNAPPAHGPMTAR